MLDAVNIKEEEYMAFMSLPFGASNEAVPRVLLLKSRPSELTIALMLPMSKNS